MRDYHVIELINRMCDDVRLLKVECSYLGAVRYNNSIDK